MVPSSADVVLQKRWFSQSDTPVDVTCIGIDYPYYLVEFPSLPIWREISRFLAWQKRWSPDLPILNENLTIYYKNYDKFLLLQHHIEGAIK